MFSVFHKEYAKRGEDPPSIEAAEVTGTHSGCTHVGWTQRLATASILWFDRPRLERTMSFCGDLVSRRPCYELHFRLEAETVDLLDELI